MNPDDPRTIRTDEALLEAVLKLAATKAVDLLTAQEVCAESGVSRTSFYRRTTQPSDILVEHFENFLAVGRLRFTTTQTEDPLALFSLNRTLSRRFVKHVNDHADVYALSLQLETSVLRQQLRRHLLSSWTGYIELHRESVILPEAIEHYPWANAREILAHQYAYGHLGLIESWVRTPERDPEVLSDLWLALSPKWSQQLMGLQPRTSLH